MVGDGVIAESIVSFNITWDSPGKGMQPEWNQNSQNIELHSVEIYPDLLYTKASGLATYFNHTNIQKILGVINRINRIIDSKLVELKVVTEASTQVGMGASTALPDSPKNTPATSTEKTEVSSPEDNKSSEDESDKTDASDFSYSVEVIGERLKLIDVQRRGGGIGDVQIVHKVSDNMVREAGTTTNQNANKIRAVVQMSGTLGRKIDLEYSDFNSESGINALVDILPSIELRFTPSEEAVVPKSESDRESENFLVDLRSLVKGTQMEKEIASADNFEKIKAAPNK
jgi:hypothetical protein